MRYLILLLIGAITAFAIPSQRDQLNAQHIKARGDFATALKTGNKDAILQAAAGLQAVGNAVNETVVYAFMALFVVNVVVTAIGIRMSAR